jgi:hypothetical protein
MFRRRFFGRVLSGVVNRFVDWIDDEKKSADDEKDNQRENRLTV